MKHWNLDITGYWVTGAVCYIEKGQELSTSPPNLSNDFRKILSLLIFINWPSLVGYWVVVQKIYLKMHSVLCTNAHHDVTDLVNHGMVKNTKTWISRERNITFLWNMCLRWHILRSYRFVVEVTFKYQTQPLTWYFNFCVSYSCRQKLCGLVLAQKFHIFWTCMCIWDFHVCFENNLIYSSYNNSLVVS